MTTEPTTDQNAEAEGRELLHQLQEIRRSLSEHAERHPRSVDFRSARREVETAIDIAVRAAPLPYTGDGIRAWLGYIVDDYARIIRADAAKLAQDLYG